MPIKINDRRGVGGYYYSRQLIDAAQATTARRQRTNFDVDHSSLVNDWDRKKLLSIGRDLFENFPTVKGVVNEMAMLAVGTYIPQFEGQDKEWGRLAENWLYEHDRIADYRGWPHNMASLTELLVTATLRDGETFVLLTEGQNNYPLFQTIPAHRVGSRTMTASPLPFGAAVERDGVYLSEYDRALGYHVLGDKSDQDVNVSAESMLAVFNPLYADQFRGISPLGCAAIDWQDVGESRRFELLAQKRAAGIALIEKNETGTADAPMILSEGTEGSCTAAPIPPVYSEEILGGEARYFRAGSGSSLEALISDRPTSNQREFAADIIRHCIYALGWSIDFSLDPRRVGGAPARIIVDKINRTLRSLRERLVAPVRRRMDGYRIAKAIKLGLLPANDEWYKWAYQGPSRITADEKYSCDVAVIELGQNLTTYQDECAKRGAWWEEVQDGNIAAMKRLKERCEQEGVDPNLVLQLSPNGGLPQKPVEPAHEQDMEDDDETTDQQ